MKESVLAEAKIYLVEGTRQYGIPKLEALLETEGFSQAIVAEELPGASWYRNNSVQHIDRTDYLKAYNNGFLRCHPALHTYAGYGIVYDFKDAGPLGPSGPPEPHHFFFIQEYKLTKDTGPQNEDHALAEYLADKGRNSPGNPMRLQTFLDKRKPQGNLLGHAGLLAAEALGLNMLSDLVPAVQQVWENETLLSAIALVILNSMLVNTQSAQRLFRRMGFESYNAAAKSSSRYKEYGIRGLEAYYELRKDRPCY
jgi:hypothetical protein